MERQSPQGLFKDNLMDYQDLAADTALVSIRTKTALPLENAISLLKAAGELNKKVVLSQALSLTGQNSLDLLFNPSYVDAVYQAAAYLIENNDENRILGFGCPLALIKDSTVIKKAPEFVKYPLINAYILIKGRKILGVVKLASRLPSRFNRIDSSSRYFTDSCQDDCKVFLGPILQDEQPSLMTCTDILEVSGIKFCFETHPDFIVEEEDGDSHHGSDDKGDNTVFLALDRSPFEAGNTKRVINSAQKISQKSGSLYCYISPLGTEAGLIYQGLSLMAHKGQILAQSCSFAFNDYASCLYDSKAVSFDGYDEMLKAAAMGVMDYMSQSGSHGAALSLSGGADSALCAVLVFYAALSALEDLGPEVFKHRFEAMKLTVPLKDDNEDPQSYIRSKVMPVLLVTLYQGSENSSDITFNAAGDLARFLGSCHYSWSIKQVVDDYIRMVDDLGAGDKLSWEKDDLALQNIQARARVPGLWLLANRTSRLLLNTANLSEAVVGYCTMDGDTAGGLAPISGIGKSTVRKINAYLEKEGLLTALGRFKVTALNKVNAQAPTAELRPGGMQTDEKDLMPYVILDAIRKALARNVRIADMALQISKDPDCSEYSLDYLKECIRKYLVMHSRSQWKRERAATGFHIEHDDAGSFLHMPVFSNDLKALSDLL